MRYDLPQCKTAVIHWHLPVPEHFKFRCDQFLNHVLREQPVLVYATAEADPVDSRLFSGFSRRMHQ